MCKYEPSIDPFVPFEALLFGQIKHFSMFSRILSRNVWLAKARKPNQKNKNYSSVFSRLMITISIWIPFGSLVAGIL